MPGAEKLKEKILAEALAQSERVLAEARQRAAETEARGEKEAAAKKEALLAQARLQAEERKRRASTIAGLDARKAILAAKEEMIEDTFRQALNRLEALDDDIYRETVLPLLLAAARTGGEEIIVSPRDRSRFTPDFLDRVNKELAARGKAGNLTLSAETRDIKGGFILRTGDVEINSSFDAILRMQRDRLEPEVAAILFGE